MKNAVLGLMVYSGLLTVFFIAYFTSIKSISIKSMAELSSQQRFILIMAVSMLLLVLVMFLFLVFLDVKVDSDIGQIGDFVGGLLNPILSFLALIAILISISIQERELGTTSSALLKQEKNLKIQTFESSLFNLLNLLRLRRAGDSYHEDGRLVKYAVKQSFDIRDYIIELKNQNPDISDRELHKKAGLYVEESMDTANAANIYYQLHVVADYIDRAELSDTEKIHYYSLVMSDFDQNELVVLLNYITKYKFMRKVLKRYYRPNIKEDFIISPLLFRYLDT
jgi:fumarate reductase subunit C